MATEENKWGVQATYFLLPTAPYFDYSQELVNKCKLLQEMGHEIGYHNNVITEWIQEDGKIPISQLIARPLNFLRKNGIVVQGTASHGDPLCNEKNYVNYMVWKEVTPRREVPEWIPRVSLTDVDLEWEAYFLPRDIYLSDSGGRWSGGTSNNTYFPENQVQDMDKAVYAFNLIPQGVMQLLVHPIWWEWKGGISYS